MTLPHCWLIFTKYKFSYVCLLYSTGSQNGILKEEKLLIHPRRRLTFQGRNGRPPSGRFARFASTTVPGERQFFCFGRLVVYLLCGQSCLCHSTWRVSVHPFTSHLPRQRHGCTCHSNGKKASHRKRMRTTHSNYNKGGGEKQDCGKICQSTFS